MKKWNLLLAVIIGSVTLSCSSDDDLKSSNSQELTSITKVYYFRNNTNPYLTEKLNFDKNKLINIEYLDGSYDLIDYDENLISKISEFDTNDNLEWTTTYTYDSSYKLIIKKVVPGPTNPITVSRQKDIVYDGSSIKTTVSWSDNGLQKNTISINSENLMIEDKLYSANDVLMSSNIFNYTDENLSKLVNKESDRSTFFEITYNYLDKTVSDAYCYNKYLFGNEWKNNSSLSYQNGLENGHSFDISKNYVKDYSFSSGIVTKTATFDYEFDVNDNIIKETRNLSESNGDTFKTTITYEYK